MALSNHIDALQTKHKHLDSAIHAEMQRPVPNFMKLADLKKSKLLVKEELVRCMDDLPHAGSA